MLSANRVGCACQHNRQADKQPDSEPVSIGGHLLFAADATLTSRLARDSEQIDQRTES